MTMDLFGLTYFWTYTKQIMEIYKLLCITHKRVSVVYEKTSYEDTIFASEDLWINIKDYLFA
jgi:hypothetical protein